MSATPSVYTGRFAPSPTGPLHAGSLVAALASWLDARAWNQGNGGRWLVRMEDLDTARNVAGAAPLILQQLQRCSLLADEAPVFQSQRLPHYEQAFGQLLARGLVYACGCSRKDIQTALAGQGQMRMRQRELVYPGTCRDGLHGKAALAWRFRSSRHGAPVDSGTTTTAPETSPVYWTDRRLGPQCQVVATAVGDFVLRRADGPFAYQLAVVVDDAAQQVSHVVRGEDLADNTARQLRLYAALNLASPRYLHTPLVLAANGEKLSKQNGAQALDTREPLAALSAAAATLGLAPHGGGVADALAAWVAQWRRLYNPEL